MPRHPTSQFASLLFATAMFAGGGASAAELGDAKVTSYLGQPLSADIELTSLHDAAGTVQARVASLDVYRGAGLEMPSVMSSVNLSVVRRDGKQYLHVTSTRPIEADHLHVYLELSDGGQRGVRLATLWFTPDPTPPAPLVRLAAAPVPAPPVVQQIAPVHTTRGAAHALPPSHQKLVRPLLETVRLKEEPKPAPPAREPVHLASADETKPLAAPAESKPVHPAVSKAAIDAKPAESKSARPVAAPVDPKPAKSIVAEKAESKPAKPIIAEKGESKAPKPSVADKTEPKAAKPSVAAQPEPKPAKSAVAAPPEAKPASKPVSVAAHSDPKAATLATPVESKPAKVPQQPKPAATSDEPKAPPLAWSAAKAKQPPPAVIALPKPAPACPKEPSHAEAACTGLDSKNAELRAELVKLEARVKTLQDEEKGRAAAAAKAVAAAAKAVAAPKPEPQARPSKPTKAVIAQPPAADEKFGQVIDEPPAPAPVFKPVKLKPVVPVGSPPPKPEQAPEGMPWGGIAGAGAVVFALIGGLQFWRHRRKQVKKVHKVHEPLPETDEEDDEQIEPTFV